MSTFQESRDRRRACVLFSPRAARWLAACGQFCEPQSSRPLLTQHRRRGSALGHAALPCRYYRLPLPVEGAPLEEDFDAFVNILRVRHPPTPTPVHCPAWRPIHFNGVARMPRKSQVCKLEMAPRFLVSLPIVPPELWISRDAPGLISQSEQAETLHVQFGDAMLGINCLSVDFLAFKSPRHKIYNRKIHRQLIFSSAQLKRARNPNS